MAYIQFVINVVAFAAILWAVNVYIPMNALIRKIVNAVVVVIAALFVLSALGFFGPMTW